MKCGLPIRNAGDLTGAVTHDTLFDGALSCLQPASGYRFSVDAVLLAHFAQPRRAERILDLGAGCGVVSLILAYRHSDIHLTALEVQPESAALARRNAAANGFAERIVVREGDLRDLSGWAAAGSFDMAFCNPPFGRPGSGRVNPVPGRAVARHEGTADLAGVVRALAYAVRTRGRAVLVYPARRTVSLLAELHGAGLEPKRLQMVHSYQGGEGKLVLVEAVRAGGESLTILPPLFLYRSPGSRLYTEAMARLYES